MMNTVHPNQAWNSSFIKSAIYKLYEYDPHIIELGTERPATAKIACYLWGILIENEYIKQFPEIRVDVEYNKRGNDPKRNSAGKLVRPDIIVHKPHKQDQNIAVIEMKSRLNIT
jgi:hypothetical protein